MRQIRGKPLSRRAKKSGGKTRRGQRSRLACLYPGAALAADPYVAGGLWRGVQTGFGYLPRRWGLYAATGLYLAAGTLGLGLSGGFSPITDTASQGFRAVAGFVTPRVQDLALTGVPDSRRVDVLMASGASPGDPILLVDTDETRAAVMELPWVREARVRRILPGRIEIAVEARAPYAIWQHDGARKVVDRDGVVIDTAVGSDFARLPLVVGKGANTQARALLEALDAAPQVKARVRAAVRVANRRWNLRLLNGIDVRLPEDDAAGAIGALAGLDAEHGLFNRDIVAIDMRLGDRLTLRLSDEAAERRFGKDESAGKTKNKKTGAYRPRMPAAARGADT